MPLDRPLLGLILMIGFCAVAPLSDAFSKLAAGMLPLGQVVLARFAVQAGVALPLAWTLGQGLRFPRQQLRWVVLRALLQIAATWLMVLSLRYLPLADAIAIAYVMPFILLLLGFFLLGEEVGRYRIAACVVGFGGTLLVMQPSFARVGWAAALPLLVALSFALFMLVTRKLTRTLNPIPLQAVNGLMGVAFILPLLLLADGTGLPDLDPAPLGVESAAYLLAFGLLGALAHLSLSWSLRFAPASTLAPVQYAEIPFAVLWGWVFFAQFPNALALAGICVVTGAGLFIIWRERRAHRPPAPPSPRATPTVPE